MSGSRWLCVLLAVMGFVACGGSADTSQSGANANAMIDQICASMGAAPCGSAQAEQDCHTWLDPEVAHASSEGCQTQLDQFLKCASSAPIQCIQYDTEPAHPVVDGSCDIGPYFECYTRVPAGCGVGVAIGGGGPVCTLKCPSFGAACTGPDPNGPVDCACDTGPHVGASFHVSSCGDEMLAYDTGHLCQ